MAELLDECGLFFDELNKIRVLDPRIANKTNELKEECKLFIESNKHRTLYLHFMALLNHFHFRN